MNYSDKLKDPRWQRKRLEIFNRDQFMCTECYGTTETLHVHHLHYLKGRDPWDYPDKYLTTLCCNCHEDIESRKKELDASISEAVNLSIKSSFGKDCLLAVLEEYWDAERIFFLLMELSDDQTGVFNTLSEMFREKVEKKKAASSPVMAEGS